MRPSISVSLEPGLERGVPWGRDLYTFVTSAAGHMMRTLQKPQKNRPSKRQVNHRRFLHNMIQRQFADIEAANHRLASTLYFREDEKNSAPSQKPKTFDQSGSPSKDSQSRSDISVCSQETEISKMKQPDSGQFCKQVPKSQRTTCTDPKNDQSRERRGEETEIRNRKLVEFTSLSSLNVPQFGAKLFQTECYDPESQLKSTSHLVEDSTQQDFIHFGQNVDISPPFSPDLSPLSLDSCDFSIQMLTDVSACAQKSIADISETQWTDIMDLFSSKDLGGCLDVDPYFESICACQGEDEQEVFADGSFSNRSEVQDLHGDTGQRRFEYRCHGGQGLTSNQAALRQTENAAETQFNRFKSNHETDIIQNQLQTSSSYNYNSSELHTYQHPPEQSSCMLGNREIIQNFTPFEGVAQYFSVPLHNTEDRPIPTPPQEDDWLFTDILKDRKSPNC